MRRAFFLERAMTKAAKIWATYRKNRKLSTKQIAEICDCGDSYVRVVLRQRPPEGGSSEIDRRYREKVAARVGVNFWTHRNRVRRARLAAITA
jgi:hypothetical protein